MESQWSAVSGRAAADGASEGGCGNIQNVEDQISAVDSDVISSARSDGVSGGLRERTGAIDSSRSLMNEHMCASREPTVAQSGVNGDGIAIQRQRALVYNEKW